MSTTVFKVYAETVTQAKARATPIIAGRLAITSAQVNQNAIAVELHDERYSEKFGFANRVATITYTT